MTCFLTSSPCLAGELALNPANGFVAALRCALPPSCRSLFICSDPDNAEKTDRFAEDMRVCFGRAGIAFSPFHVLDGRNANQAALLVRQAELVILAGGHVPTQNRFFQQIALREMLREFSGVVVGISAGTMNSADMVYAHPELPGEATSPDYRRFLPGLGLTEAMVIPHYQMLQDVRLDGLRTIEDIACPDSAGRRFYALPDGSYLYIRDGRQELRGEAYLIEEGRLRQIGREGDVLPL